MDAHVLTQVGRVGERLQLSIFLAVTVGLRANDYGICEFPPPSDFTGYGRGYEFGIGVPQTITVPEESGF